MIAISSPRPHTGQRQYALNQRLAHASWEQVFTKVVYFGKPEQELLGQKTVFVEAEEWPTIQALAHWASTERGFTAILNADIVVTPEILQLEVQMHRKNQLCASSRRWNFRNKGGLLVDMIGQAQLGNERGRDIFIAHARAWTQVAQQIPPFLRIGNPMWDAWMTDFFRAQWNDKFVDFTAMRCVFHPEHEGRNYPYAEQITKLYPR